MTTRRATRWVGAVVAALTLTTVTSVAPASAAQPGVAVATLTRVTTATPAKPDVAVLRLSAIASASAVKSGDDRVQIQKRDTGWNVP